MYAEFVGLKDEALVLIERLRQTPEESRSDILVRVLSSLLGREDKSSAGFMDLGEGVKLAVGEKPVLFLSKRSKQLGKPDAVAEIMDDGFYLDGFKIPPSRRGNPLDPAMKMVQKQKSHRNANGEIISLSAWRQWHVLRNGKYVPLIELKDPRLAHTRGRISGEMLEEQIADFEFGNSGRFEEATIDETEEPMADQKTGEIDIDIDELIRWYEENQARKKLRKERPWTSDIIRALWGSWLTMDRLTKELWTMRNPSGLNMPEAFRQTIQSCLNQHTSQSSRWDGNPKNDLFYSPKGKGSGTWAVHQDRALAWLRSKGLPPA